MQRQSVRERGQNTGETSADTCEARNLGARRVLVVSSHSRRLNPTNACLGQE